MLQIGLQKRLVENYPPWIKKLSNHQQQHQKGSKQEFKCTLTLCFLLIVFLDLDFAQYKLWCHFQALPWVAVVTLKAFNMMNLLELNMDFAFLSTDDKS